jgi:hypothetical protein
MFITRELEAHTQDRKCFIQNVNERFGEGNLRGIKIIVLDRA